MMRFIGPGPSLASGHTTIRGEVHVDRPVSRSALTQGAEGLASLHMTSKEIRQARALLPPFE